jgi:hypothetical protein
MKTLKVYRVDSPDGEIHLVIEENRACKHSDCLTNVANLKKATREEASKPLILLRKE